MIDLFEIAHAIYELLLCEKSVILWKDNDELKPVN